MTGRTAETFGRVNIGFEIFRRLRKVLHTEGKMAGGATIVLRLRVCMSHGAKTKRAKPKDEKNRAS